MRLWATLGNVARISAVFGVLSGAYAGYQAISRFQIGGADNVVRTEALATVIFLAVAVLLWLLKPVLISNRPPIIGPIVRILVVVYVILWVIGTLGLGLIFIGIVYLFTATPSPYEYASSGPRQQVPKFRAPSNFQPSGRVGPSGATLYSDSMRTELVGHFDSYIPIQVLEERNGFSHVVAGTGQSGWIDARTVSAL